MCHVGLVLERLSEHEELKTDIYRHITAEKRAQRAHWHVLWLDHNDEDRFFERYGTIKYRETGELIHRGRRHTTRDHGKWVITPFLRGIGLCSQREANRE